MLLPLRCRRRLRSGMCSYHSAVGADCGVACAPTTPLSAQIAEWYVLLQTLSPLVENSQFTGHGSMGYTDLVNDG